MDFVFICHIFSAQPFAWFNDSFWRLALLVRVEIRQERLSSVKISANRHLIFASDSGDSGGTTCWPRSDLDSPGLPCQPSSFSSPPMLQPPAGDCGLCTEPGEPGLEPTLSLSMARRKACKRGFHDPTKYTTLFHADGAFVIV